MDTVATTCSQCGEPVRGRFCTSCGTPMDAVQIQESASDDPLATSTMSRSDVQSILSGDVALEPDPVSASFGDVETAGIPDSIDATAPLDRDGEIEAAQPATIEPDAESGTPPRRRGPLTRLLMMLFGRRPQQED